MSLEIAASRLWLWHSGRGSRGTCCQTLPELLANHLEPAGFSGQVGPGQAITLFDGPGVLAGSMTYASRAVGGDPNDARRSSPGSPPAAPA